MDERIKDCEGHDQRDSVDDRVDMAGDRWLAFRQQLTCIHCGYDHWTAHVRHYPRAHWVIICKQCQGKLIDPRGFVGWKPK